MATRPVHSFATGDAGMKTAAWIARGRSVDTIVSRSVIALKSGMDPETVAAAQRVAYVGLPPEKRTP